MIFGFFDPVIYDGVPMADIFRSYKKYFDEISSNFVLQKFYITGSPRPELLSYKLYGDVSYYWVLLMLNEILDPFHGWIKDEEAVHKSCEQRYKNKPNGVNEILYHVDSDGKPFWRMKEYPVGSGNWYDIGDSLNKYLQHHGTLVPVTAIEHDLNENERKRTITIVAPNDISKFLDMLTRRLERIRDGS